MKMMSRLMMMHSNFERTKTFIYPLYPKPPTKRYFIRSGQPLSQDFLSLRPPALVGQKDERPWKRPGVGAGTQETCVRMRSRMLHGTNNPLFT